jgi:L-threonylcarbamoyladenylate synthase
VILAFDAAVEALKAGSVVAIPTDTVYGFAVDPTCPGATGAIFDLKGRPRGLELPVLVASVQQADALAGPGGLPAPAQRLARALWPGALTIVVLRPEGLHWELGGRGDTIGLRVPDHAVARALCERVGPLATTSANRHGAVPCTDAEVLTREFGDGVLVVDGGTCSGEPSTVVSVVGGAPRCIRQGAVAWADVTAAAGSAQ